MSSGKAKRYALKSVAVKLLLAAKVAFIRMDGAVIVTSVLFGFFSIKAVEQPISSFAHLPFPVSVGFGRINCAAI